jgi:hypothetical protein
VFLELRRLQDTDAIVRGSMTRQFVVTKRLGEKVRGVNLATKKNFDTLPEARAYWCEQAMRLEDEGRLKMDLKIAGFHEED